MKVNNTNPVNKTSFRGLEKISEKGYDKLCKIGKLTSVHQRALLGTTALVLQPTIDFNNRQVDEKTRKTSFLRSAAKAIVCTATGVTIRATCIKASELIVKNAKKLPEYVKKDIEQSKNVIGTMIALGVMLFTNFIIDTPLTNKLTEFFNKKYDEKTAKKSETISKGTTI